MKLKEELKELRIAKIEELRRNSIEEKKKNASLLLSVRAGKFEKYSDIKKSKKRIARIETIINELESQNE
jgi:ribosomal protein L29